MRAIGRTVAAGAFALMLVAMGAPIARAGYGPNPVPVIVLPDAEARAYLVAHHGAFGVGVFPDSRDASAFYREIAAGAPRSREGVRSPLAGRACTLSRALDDAHLLVRAEVHGSAPSMVHDAVAAIACGASQEPAVEASIHGAGDAATAGKVSISGVAIVVGVARTTPLVVGLVGAGAGLLDGGMSRRPGVVLPYDITATILQRGRDATRNPIAAGAIIGKPLHVRPDPDPERTVARLASRFERDAGIGHGVSAATICILLGGGIILTGLLLLAGAPSLALRTARGGAAGVSGYVFSLFIPSGNAALRAIPLVAAFALAALWPKTDRVARQIGVLFVVGSSLIAALTIAAALRPGGEPALSLWGDPLVSWRLYGLRNHLTSMLELGVLAGVGLVAPAASRTRVVRAQWFGVAAGAVVAGAAVLGANFVAVFTLVFGGAVVASVLARERLTVRAVVSSAVLAAGAFVAALLADARGAATHGGQAVRTVQHGGARAAWDYVWIRLRLNVHEIRNLPGGWIYTVLLVAGLMLLVRWAWRDASIPTGARAAMLGGAASALAALVAEDTGFLTGGTVALAPGLAAACVLASRIRPRSARSSGAG